jgi:transposase
MTIVTRRYTFKLYPTKAQAEAMQRQAALLAMLWNAALEQREAQWAQECQRKPRGDRKGLSFYDQSKDVKFIRADDPEFAQMSADTPPLCLQALDDAFKAFFKRAKGGAGKASGYPKYKSPYAIEHKGADCTIWHRDMPKGWRMEKSGKHFRVYAKGLCDLKDRSTWIKARGRFPIDMDSLVVRDMRLIRVAGVWHCSVVVKMEARITSGNAPLSVVFDLINEFARVENRANGECLTGWADGLTPSVERITSREQEVSQASAEEALEFWADGRSGSSGPMWRNAEEVSETGADGRFRWPYHSASIAEEASNSGADGRWRAQLRAVRQAEEILSSEDNGKTFRLEAASELDADEIQSDRDRRFKKFSCRWRREKRRIARLKAQEARCRKEALHKLTTEIIRRASELTVVCPNIREATKSARGDEKYHGAAVKTVALLNRHILSQAPAAAIAMLEYKAAEAGIQFALVTPAEHAVDVGRDLQTATKAARKASRHLKKEEAA